MLIFAPFATFEVSGFKNSSGASHHHRKGFSPFHYTLSKINVY